MNTCCVHCGQSIQQAPHGGWFHVWSGAVPCYRNADGTSAGCAKP